MTTALTLLVGAVALSPLALFLAVRVASSRGWWSMSRRLGRIAPYVFGGEQGRILAFDGEVFALREEGRLRDAVALCAIHLRDEDVHPHIRNSSIDALISAGAYTAALAAAPADREAANASEAMNLALIEINLAEAEYNLGRWDAAEERLRPLDPACRRFPICWAGLLVQRAWIAAHGGRATEALAVCKTVDPRWFPPPYRSEYYFTGAAALLAAGRLDEADAAVTKGERAARRLSSRRNALFLRARVAAARGEWETAERLCREAAGHPFRGQGGDGLLLWAEALRKLGRDRESDEVLRLVSERDPESESAAIARTGWKPERR